MKTLLTFVGALLGLLAAVALLLLLVPIHVAVRGVFTERLVDASAHATWGGVLRLDARTDGIVLRLLRWPVWRYRHRATPEGVGEPKRAEEKPGKVRRPWRPGLRLVLRVARRLVASLKLRARLSGRVGTGDPADTARVFGALALSRRVVPGLDTRSLQLDWLEPVVDLEGEARARIWPVSIAWILVSELVRTRWRAA